MKASQPVLYFDGVCNLCNRVIQYVIRHDRKERFLFAPLRPEAGMEPAGGTEAQPDSVLLVWNGRRYRKSAAVLQTCRLLGGWHLLLCTGWLVPRFIRDFLYDLIARSRYRIFGKRDSCMIPSPELSKRFIPG